MLKFVTLCFLVWHEMCKFSSHAEQLLDDTSIPNLHAIVVSKINGTDMQSIIEPRVIHNWNVGQQTIYINGPLFERAGIGRDLNNVPYTPKNYTETIGIGAHKVHRMKLTWDKARRICIEDGGHLAVIRSDVEERVVLKMMSNMSVDYAWVGYHRQFDGDDWISVLDEPLNDCEWKHWSTKFNRSSKPSNCAKLVREGGGLDDRSCSNEEAFICKISTI